MRSRHLTAAQGAVDAYPGGPRALARDLELTVTVRSGTVGYAEVEDEAVAAYWRNRVVYGPRCGSRYGWDDHRAVGSRPCADCREAHRLDVAIWRKRRTAVDIPVGDGNSTPADPFDGGARHAV